MNDTQRVFQQLQAEGVQYPTRRFPYGSSPCHYWARNIQRPLRNLITRLKPHAQYLELGCFLGAGSTTVALHYNPTIQIVCVDHWRITGNISYKPINRYRPGTRTEVDFLQNKGSALEHFLNNTWQWRSRVAPLQQVINQELLYELYDKGYRPDLILIDDNHTMQPVLDRLEAIKELWPTTQVLLDDYSPSWDGVRKGVQEAFRRGWYLEADSRLIRNRLMLLKRSAPEHVKAREVADAKISGDTVADTETVD